jgi:phosphoribosylformylglycinamidine synthase II
MRDPQIWREMGLNDEEYQKICTLMQREPTDTELGMFAVMWSEHCGYKYSRPVLRLFKKYKEAMEAGGFENAGVVPLTEEIGIAMKVESHNHPSAVEPHQGAATGVGGIIRDIFTMGARPIASLNSLRFGPLHEPRNRYLLEHVVEGIAHYGNCVGVPTVAGEVYFHERYSGNPLVNAMAVGVVPLQRLMLARADVPGSAVMYVGSSTGRDGIHGATFASEALGEDSEEKRPNVQIGDPFMEKLLIEATLEAIETGVILGLQDMGAAGLTCTTCEPTSKSGTGVDIDVALVPRREQGMTPYEVMLSESQERMLLYVKAGQEQAVADIYRKWELNAVNIGHVTSDGVVRVRDKGQVVAEIPATYLTHECPTYELQTEEPGYLHDLRELDIESLLQPSDWNATLLQILRSPNIASKRWIYEQYDWLVQTQTVLPPGEGDAAVLRIRGTQKGIALKIDGNGRHCYLDPFLGGQIAVAEAARNVACTGAMPRAITDCLNFGNPQKPHVFYQFQKCVEGIAKASEHFDTPVISGNVSFYNESEIGEVLPTPTIGMLGVLENVENRVGAGFPEPGLKVLLVSDKRLTGTDEPQEHGLGASEYLSVIHGLERGAPAGISLEAERSLQRFLVETASRRLIRSAHDLSDGGFAVALAECAMIGNVGADVELAADAFGWTDRTDAALFGERHTRVLISAGQDKVNTLQTLAGEHGLACLLLGTTGGEHLTIRRQGTALVDLSLQACKEAYESLMAQV